MFKFLFNLFKKTPQNKKFENYITDKNKIKKLLVLVHPNFNICHQENLLNTYKIEKYYDDIKRYIVEFDGTILIHATRPCYEEKDTNIKRQIYLLQLYFTEWLIDLKKENVYLFFGDVDKLLDISEEIKNKMEYNSKIYFGGGYLGVCLVELMILFENRYYNYLKDNEILTEAVPHLIYAWGGEPIQLSKHTFFGTFNEFFTH